MSGPGDFRRSDFSLDVDIIELNHRAVLFAKARSGHEDALADLRDGYGIRTLVINHRPLIREGVLVGARKSQR